MILKLKSALSAALEFQLGFLCAHCQVIIIAKKLQCTSESARPFSTFCPSPHLSNTNTCTVARSHNNNFFDAQEIWFPIKALPG